MSKRAKTSPPPALTDDADLADNALLVECGEVREELAAGGLDAPCALAVVPEPHVVEDRGAAVLPHDAHKPTALVELRRPHEEVWRRGGGDRGVRGNDFTVGDVVLLWRE